MNEIKCPNCGEVFTVDEVSYASILNQVRTKEFELEVEKRLGTLSEVAKKDSELKLSNAVSEKDKEIDKLNFELEQADSALKQQETEFQMKLTEVASEKDNEIIRLSEQLKNIEKTSAETQKAEIAKVSAEKDAQINELMLRIKSLESESRESENASKLAVTEAVNAEKQRYEEKLNEKNEEITKKNEEIIRLGVEIEKTKIESSLAVKEAVSEVEKERDTQKAEYEAKLKTQQESIEYYRDLKTRMSTKMIGETLEQHCEMSFNMIRATAFRNAEFSKDNKVVEGSKGDYVYREKDEYGNEIISIMFEMKNEMDITAVKHKNEDFFAKLDRDRKNKKCEYAILVSLLEADNELYNQGIVDVSYEYEKMYVIRPQFFIPMITILRNAAMNSMEYKRQLADIRNQEIDITNFEQKIENFKEAFSKNYILAGKQFNTAIDEIDKTIDHLKKVKDNLQRSINNLRLANDKAQNQLTIKSLTKDNPTMEKMFNDIYADEG